MAIRGGANVRFVSDIRPIPIQHEIDSAIAQSAARRVQNKIGAIFRGGEKPERALFEIRYKLKDICRFLSFNSFATLSAGQRAFCSKFVSPETIAAIHKRFETAASAPAMVLPKRPPTRPALKEEDEE
jgi:hypothetical protein